MASILSDTMLAGWLAGAARAVRGLPISTSPDSTAEPPPASADQPPAGTPPLTPATGQNGEPDDEPIVRFPLIDEARRDLEERRVLTRADFDDLAADAKQTAFTAARVTNEEALGRLHQAVTASVAEGGTLADFRAAVDEALGPDFLSPGHVENIFRTNVAQAYSAGLMETLAHPLVADEFPYLAYHAVHDARVRPDHLAMEHRGLDSTNIYRRDDPIWERFTPPWDWNCVPFESLIQTAKGRRPIGEIQRGEAVLTHRGRWRTVIGTHRSEGPAELVALEIEGQASLVRATGNHRILTQRGWIEASRLNIDDQVYQLRQPAHADVIMLEVEDRPQFESIADGSVSFGIRPAGVLNFNSDVSRREKEVQPKREGLLVELERNGALLESCGEGSFMRAHPDDPVDVLSWIVTNRLPPRLDHLGSHFGTARGAMNAIGCGDPLCSFWMEGVVQLIRSRETSHSDAAIGENAPYSTEGDARFVGDVLDRNASGLIVGEQRREAARPSGQSGFGTLEIGSASVRLPIHTYNCNIKAARIKSIRRVRWGKPVYNLSVDEDESYICDGIAMHNCRCAIVPMGVEDAARAGVTEAREWLRTGQATAAPEWVQMPPFGPPEGWGGR